MRAVSLIVVTLATAWMQVAWFGHMRPLGIIPNLMLVLVVVCALWSQASITLGVGVGGGLLLDLASGDGNFGLRMGFFAFMALAIVAGRQLGLQSDSIVAGVVATIIGTLLYNLAILATINAGLSTIVVERIGRELIVNLLILLLVYIARANFGSRSRTTFELAPRLRR